MATKVNKITIYKRNPKKKGVSKRKYNKHNPKPKLSRGQG